MCEYQREGSEEKVISSLPSDTLQYIIDHCHIAMDVNVDNTTVYIVQHMTCMWQNQSPPSPTAEHVRQNTSAGRKIIMGHPVEEIIIKTTRYT